MTTLSMGVVGLGLGRYHVAAYACAEAVGRLVICDADAQRLEATRAAYPQVAAAYETLSQMLEHEQLDAVSVVTPDHLHRSHAQLCFAAGCDLLLTKPLATNLEDGRAIVQAARDSGRILMVAHERRFRTRIRAVRDLLETGRLGEIIHLRIDAIQDKRRQFQHSPWYASVEAGRSALVGSGIHEVDLLRFLIGRPILSVSAYSNRLGDLSFPKDKTTAAVYQFDGGAIGQVTVTYEARWPPLDGSIDDHFRLVASKGMVVGNKVTWNGADHWEALPVDASEIEQASYGCVEAFLETLAHNEPVAVSGEEAFSSLAAAVAADVSAAAGGKPVVPETLHRQDIIE